MNSRKQTILAAAIGAGLILLSNVFVRAETSADDHGALFKQLDANGDGFVVVKEIDKEKQRLFDRMLRTGDSNDDGRLTPAEFAVSLTPPKQPKERVGMAGYAGDGRVLEKLLNQLDRDRDGKLSKDEAPTRLRQSFAQIDAAGDGGRRRAGAEPKRLRRSPTVLRRFESPASAWRHCMTGRSIRVCSMRPSMRS